MLYGGLSRNSYKKTRLELMKNNRLNLIVFSCLGITTILTLIIYALIQRGSILLNVCSYLVLLFIFLFILLLNLFIRKVNVILNYACVFIFMMAILGIGIWLGLVGSPNQMTASYLAILMLLPCLFYLKPISYIAVVFISDFIYIMLACRIQSGELLLHNVVNVIVFGCLSIATGTYSMSIRAAKYNSERINRELSYKDQLTGLGNRRSYENELDVLRKTKDLLSVIAFDINNLKRNNDIFGHKAGDEMIKATADCIYKVFNDVGNCFRIGGDEFVVIMHEQISRCQAFLKDFDLLISNWKGELVEELSVSYGYASSDSNPQMDINSLVTLADKNMYNNKTEYYKKTGQDRRGS